MLASKAISVKYIFFIIIIVFCDYYFMFNCKLYCYTLAKLRFISLACSKIDANQANKLCKRLHSGTLFFYYIIKVYVVLEDNYY